MNQKQKLFEYLEIIAPLLPIPLCWINTNNIILGINKLALKVVGAQSHDDFVGKSIHDLYQKEIADKITQHNNEVIRTGQMLSQEEVLKNVSTGETRYFTSFKIPLRDDKRNIIGIVVALIDITDAKRAETLKIEKNKLEIENEMYSRFIQEQEKFKKITDQAIHGIQSPIASMLMTIESCKKDLQKSTYIALQEAVSNIDNVVNTLISKHRKEYMNMLSETTERHPILVSITLLQILNEKKHQYRNLPVKFSHDFNQHSKFSFINAESFALKQTIANLIDNAVEALEEKAGDVCLYLNSDGNNVNITIQDSGKGMPKNIIDKIISNITVTNDKKNGTGLGFAQTREFLKQNQGTLAIYSKINKGTKIALTFPKTKAPEWMVEKITLNKDDTVVVLDDDHSVHRAWKAVFKKIKEVHLKYFTSGKDAIKFINFFLTKDRIFLLADFELLKQELNGLDVIEQTNTKRAILVTSYYANKTVLELAEKSNIKILPKQLASEITIEVN